jgi:hypothetical protein
MKTQDIVILLKIIILGKEKWRTTDIAHQLHLSQSEISKGLKRLEESRLYSRENKAVSKRAFYELLIYGLPAFFPGKVGKLSKGVPTSISNNILGEEIITDDTFVWPHINGSLRGESVTPLYPSAPDAALEDKELYDFLTIIDVLRIGRVREVNLARKELKRRFFENE